MTENALFILIVIFSVQLRQTEISEIKLFIFHLGNMWISWGAAHEGGGCDQSIGYTISDVIVRSWLWSTATRSSPLDYFSNHCK